MEHDRQAGFLRDRPQRIEADVAGRMVVRAARRDQQRLGAKLDRLARRLGCALEVEQRHIAGRQQALVDRAEIDHVAGVRARHGIGEVVVLAAFQHVGEIEQRRGEHELAGEAQQVDRARAVLLAPRAERVPVLGQHDLRIVEVSPTAPLGILQPAVEAVAAREQHVVGDGGAVLRLEMVGEEARHFHDVRIGIVNDAPAGVGHGFLRSFVGAELSMSADISKAVQQLLEARRSGVQVAPPFALPDRAAVYAIQDGVAQATGPVSGWKVGARTPTAEPNPAPLLAGALVKSPATFDGKAMHMIGVEIEISFHIARDIAARSAAGRPR